MRHHRGSIQPGPGMDVHVRWPSRATCHAQQPPRKSRSALKTQGEKSEEKNGVERHQAIGGREAALLRRTPGNLRLPEAMKTSRVGHGHGKPAFFPSGVRSGLQTAGRTFDHVRRAHQVDTKTRGLNPKCATVARCGIA